MEDAERWLQDVFAPVVMVCSTPEVERISRKNHLSFVDLLNGFSRVSNIEMPLRSANHALTLGTLSVRFLAPAQFTAMPLVDSVGMLNRVVQQHPPRHMPATSSVVDLELPPLQSVDDVPTFLRAINAAKPSFDQDKTAQKSLDADGLPWYSEFKRALLDTFICEEFSLLCHPVVQLLAVSSTESNPRHSFEQLAAPQNLPQVFLDGLYDASLPTFYVVVHDEAETQGTAIDPDAILHNLTIPAQTGAVLRINSRGANAPSDANEQIWLQQPFARAAVAAMIADTTSARIASEYLGAFLAEKDMASIRSFVTAFALKFVIPALENRIFQLNEVVTAMKKGVRNVFKSWLRKPKDISTRVQANNNNVMYRYDAIEAQTRLLADTAFVVRDYELALQTYRLARDDFRSDKASFHAANVNEMIALCLLLTKGSPMQMANALEAASAAYFKAPSPLACRLAVRAAVIAGEVFITLSNSGLMTDYMDQASSALIRGSTAEQGICSALLMERAAMCDLQARQPKFRKFGFRMVMAGHVYESLGHSAHAARCNALARAVYDYSGWFQVEDHINLTLAEQANRLHDPMASINLFLKLIGTGRNSASQQERLLYDFGLIVQEFLSSGTLADMTSRKSGPVCVSVTSDPSTKKLLVHDLCMPELNDKSVVVFAPVNAAGINRDIDGNPSEGDLWKGLDQIITQQTQLHEMMTDKNAAQNGGKPPQSWLTQTSGLLGGYRMRKGSTIKKPKQYALGEKIFVEMEMKNALSCAVDVENIRLFGTFEPSQGAKFDFPESEDSSNDRIVVEHLNLQLLPCSEEHVRLSICSQIPGRLQITGIRWSICGGNVHGEHAFNIPGPLLQDTRANKEARARAPNMSLLADVVSPMPWLGVQIDRDNRDAYVGEVISMNMKLFNAGPVALGGLQLCCSDLQLCAASSVERPAAQDYANYVGATGQVLNLSKTTLAPGESRSFRLWARGLKAGKQQVHLLFKYGPTAALADASKAWTRPLKHKLDVNLLPSVDVSYSIDPSYAVNGEYLLGLSVANRRRDAAPSAGSNLRLERLICFSKRWRIEPYSAFKQPGARDASMLGVHEVSTTYFRVTAKTNESDVQSSVTLNTSESEVIVREKIDALPLTQLLCLDFATEALQQAEAAARETTGVGDRPMGMRSIQSVRRENKAANPSDPTSQRTENKPPPQPTTREALLDPLDIDGHLTLVWSTRNASSPRHDTNPLEGLCIGQTNLTPIRVRSLLKENSCPLTITLEYADAVTLKPISTSASCSLAIAEVDVIMTVRNDSILTSPPLDFTLELLHPDEVQPARAIPGSNDASNTLAPAPHILWSGLTKKRVTRFTPNAQTSIHLKACFTAAGVYDLNRFRFVVSSSAPATSDTETTPTTPLLPATSFVFPVEYLINVRAPASTRGVGGALDLASESTASISASTQV